ncbi:MULTISPECIES: PKD domain-containing protein [Nostocales]|uniref:PKD domain-containing protein n=3 Tax=Nostocales TaxID=1161 RepID=A0A8S9TF82_9CYAN|nr:PKD domain-containing protein [Tolypothrix bouteillei]KAF3890828.1 PKD domain-containing protein [Tolypothrix bouteillei VB521301]
MTTVTGQTVSHTFVDNGTYTATLTVTDSMGTSVVQTLSLSVNNVAPRAIALDDFAVNKGTAISLNGSFTDRISSQIFLRISKMLLNGH